MNTQLTALGKKSAFGLKLLHTSCIALLGAQPALLGAALLVLLDAPVAIAQAQGAEAVAKVAQAITVRIEGATQGSGVLVKRDGNRYIVLTAWHVVSGQRPGEELDIYTPDGQRHQLEQGSIKRLGQVDMAVLTFTSFNPYEVVTVGDVRRVSMGNPVWVSGFPLPSSAVPTRLLRLIKGDVVANATVPLPDGYQLLYDNQTLPGVSGGAVLNAQGRLVGIHGRAEKADQISDSSGKMVATGTNQGVPISYYNKYIIGEVVTAPPALPVSIDDYMAQARSLLVKKGGEQDVVRLADRILAINQNAKAYLYRAYAKYGLGDKQGAISDYSRAIAIDPQDTMAYVNRGAVKSELGDKKGAIADYSQAIAVDPQDAKAYSNRGAVKLSLGDKLGAIADFSRAIAVNPQEAVSYYNRGLAKSGLGDKKGAIADYSRAIALNLQDARVYLGRGNSKFESGDTQGAIVDYSRAITVNPQEAMAYYNRGNAKSDIGDNKGAIADYSRAIAINPRFDAAYRNRGIVYESIGDLGRACMDWRVAASLGSVKSRDWTRRQCQ